jgi:hypothetical protein
MPSVQIILPYHLRNLAKIEGDVHLQVEEPVTVCSVLDALEAAFPMLSGTVRDHVTKVRRPFVRFFACGEDRSNDPVDDPLPEAIARGEAPFRVVGAIAGG